MLRSAGTKGPGRPRFLIGAPAKEPMQRENTLISSEASRGPIDRKGKDAPKSGVTYMAIPPGAIIPGSLPKFKIYVPLQSGQYVLWTPDGETVTPDQLARLSASGQKEVYVALDEKINTRNTSRATWGLSSKAPGRPTSRRPPFSAPFPPTWSGTPSKHPWGWGRWVRTYWPARGQ